MQLQISKSIIITICITAMKECVDLEDTYKDVKIEYWESKKISNVRWYV